MIDLPVAAWDQAVFVSLFVVFCLALTAGLMSWFSKLQASWQDFIETQNDNWQKWLDRDAQRTSANISSVVTALERLSEKMDAHDDKVDARIEAARARDATTNRKTVPRKPSQ